jgi:hypothetical protein
VRRLAIIIAIGCLTAAVGWSQSAGAKVHKRTRTASGAYATPAVGAAGRGGGQCSQSGGFGCVELSTRKSEHSVRISIKDQSGQPVYASVTQDKATGDGVHMTVPVGDICGKTTKPLKIQGGYPIDVFLWEGPGADPPCAGVATQGTVKATFS